MVSLGDQSFYHLPEECISHHLVRLQDTSMGLWPPPELDACAWNTELYPTCFEVVC